MTRLYFGIAAMLLGLGATLAGPPPAMAVTQVDTSRFFIDQTTLPFNALSGTSTQRFWGVTNGAGWRVEIPNNWNGDLVLYAHGYAGEGAQLGVQIPNTLRPHLIARGYAWAASSYRANGYVPGTGAEDTHELLKIVKQEVKLLPSGKKPQVNRVYLYGASMGGHVVGHMIERWGNSYAGALPTCGVMGDNELFDFFQDMYLIAETVVGNTPIVPTPADYFTNPQQGWLVTRAKLGSPFPTTLTPEGDKFKQIIENLSGGDRPIYDEGFVGANGGAFAFNFGSAVAGPGRENLETVYQLDTNPALSPEEQLFNASIVRVPLDKQFRDKNGIFNSATSSPYLEGKFKMPVVSLHTIGELFVPFHMEQIYARRAIEAGNDHLLVQRAIRGRAHCEFLPAELNTAFDDLVNWVVNGVKPEGDDILNPAAVAAPNFGCRFTAPGHPGNLPACQ